MPVNQNPINPVRAFAPGQPKSLDAAAPDRSLTGRWHLGRIPNRAPPVGFAGGIAGASVFRNPGTTMKQTIWFLLASAISAAAGPLENAGMRVVADAQGVQAPGYRFANPGPKPDAVAGALDLGERRIARARLVPQGGHLDRPRNAPMPG